MDRDLFRFIEALGFDRAWVDWGMYPPTLHAIQSNDFKTGDEEGGEHFRYGAFQWWLTQTMDDHALAKLLLLTYLDDDAAMAQAARDDIAQRFGDRAIRVRDLCLLGEGPVRE